MRSYGELWSDQFPRGKIHADSIWARRDDRQGGAAGARAGDENGEGGGGRTAPTTFSSFFFSLSGSPAKALAAGTAAETGTGSTVNPTARIMPVIAPGFFERTPTRAALSAHHARKRFRMCRLQPLTRPQVQVLPRQWRVVPNSDSLLRVAVKDSSLALHSVGALLEKYVLCSSRREEA